MKKQILEAQITSLYVNHKEHWKRYGSDFSHRARMTLWAVTDLGHKVWLETKEPLTRERIEKKKKEYLESSTYEVGDKIKYEIKEVDSKIGFIRDNDGNRTDRKDIA